MRPRWIDEEALTMKTDHNILRCRISSGKWNVMFSYTKCYFLWCTTLRSRILWRARPLKELSLSHSSYLNGIFSLDMMRICLQIYEAWYEDNVSSSPRHEIFYEKVENSTSELHTYFVSTRRATFWCQRHFPDWSNVKLVTSTISSFPLSPTEFQLEGWNDRWQKMNSPVDWLTLRSGLAAVLRIIIEKRCLLARFIAYLFRVPVACHRWTDHLSNMLSYVAWFMTCGHEKCCYTRYQFIN